MNKFFDHDIYRKVNEEYSEPEKTVVLKELESIKLEHVMAKSKHNLRNTRMAILKLAEGDLEKVKQFTKQAKIDFRDVILWASQQK